ncbi:MAG: hypothetical protein Ct9H300mP28_05900 [Pseudomonadota bacterium]|nr:MAG: hypothetical protein Ct9H300mP28_05900 [Pseudomonadota bacterium]
MLVEQVVSSKYNGFCFSLYHIPSGIVVQCQNERSQHKNKATAMKMLKAQLFDLQQKELNKEKDLQNSKKQENAWGAKSGATFCIRTSWSRIIVQTGNLEIHKQF